MIDKGTIHRKEKLCNDENNEEKTIFFSNNNDQLNNEDDNQKDQSINADQAIQKCIKKKKQLYDNLLIFLESPEENDNDFQNIIQIFNMHEEKRQAKFKDLLQLLSSISNNHHRTQILYNKIFQIIKYFKKKIKQTFSNIEIFRIFQSNKKILLFLFKIQLITVDDDICQTIITISETNGNSYCHFFYSEIKDFISEWKKEDIKKELLSKDPNIFDKFDEKRLKGENDSYICNLIRRDSVEEFVSFVNRKNISLKSKINCSIFETNSFLIENNPTLIEYSAFFGSIQIFQYLLFNNVDLTPSLWIYAIHSQNAELIHLLESYNIDQPKDKFACLIESIKCHHNAFAEYSENNLVLHEVRKNEKVLSNAIKFHNYKYFPPNFEYGYEFFYLCYYNYDKLVNLFIKKKEESIKKILIQKILIFLFLINLQSKKLYLKIKLKLFIIYCLKKKSSLLTF